jgi:hypothetical protein
MRKIVVYPAGWRQWRIVGDNVVADRKSRRFTELPE